MHGNNPDLDSVSQPESPQGDKVTTALQRMLGNPQILESLLKAAGNNIDPSILSMIHAKSDEEFGERFDAFVSGSSRSGTPVSLQGSGTESPCKPLVVSSDSAGEGVCEPLGESAFSVSDADAAVEFDAAHLGELTDAQCGSQAEDSLVSNANDKPLVGERFLYGLPFVGATGFEDGAETPNVEPEADSSATQATFGLLGQPRAEQKFDQETSHGGAECSARSFGTLETLTAYNRQSSDETRATSEMLRDMVDHLLDHESDSLELENKQTPRSDLDAPCADGADSSKDHNAETDADAADSEVVFHLGDDDSPPLSDLPAEDACQTEDDVAELETDEADALSDGHGHDSDAADSAPQEEDDDEESDSEFVDASSDDVIQTGEAASEATYPEEDVEEAPLVTGGAPSAEPETQDGDAPIPLCPAARESELPNESCTEVLFGEREVRCQYTEEENARLLSLAEQEELRPEGTGFFLMPRPWTLGVYTTSSAAMNLVPSIMAHIEKDQPTNVSIFAEAVRTPEELASVTPADVAIVVVDVHAPPAFAERSLCAQFVFDGLMSNLRAGGSKIAVVLLGAEDGYMRDTEVCNIETARTVDVKLDLAYRLGKVLTVSGTLNARQADYLRQLVLDEFWDFVIAELKRFRLAANSSHSGTISEVEELQEGQPPIGNWSDSPMDSEEDLLQFSGGDFYERGQPMSSTAMDLPDCEAWRAHSTPIEYETEYPISETQLDSHDASQSEKEVARSHHLYDCDIMIVSCGPRVFWNERVRNLFDCLTDGTGLRVQTRFVHSTDIAEIDFPYAVATIVLTTVDEDVKQLLVKGREESSLFAAVYDRFVQLCDQLYVVLYGQDMDNGRAEGVDFAYGVYEDLVTDPEIAALLREHALLTTTDFLDAVQLDNLKHRLLYTVRMEAGVTNPPEAGVAEEEAVLPRNEGEACDDAAQTVDVDTSKNVLSEGLEEPEVADDGGNAPENGLVGASDKNTETQVSVDVQEPVQSSDSCSSEIERCFQDIESTESERPAVTERESPQYTPSPVRSGGKTMEELIVEHERQTAELQRQLAENEERRQKEAEVSETKPQAENEERRQIKAEVSKTKPTAKPTAATSGAKKSTDEDSKTDESSTVSNTRRKKYSRVLAEVRREQKLKKVLSCEKLYEYVDGFKKLGVSCSDELALRHMLMAEGDVTVALSNILVEVSRARDSSASGSSTSSNRRVQFDETSLTKQPKENKRKKPTVGEYVKVEVPAGSMIAIGETPDPATVDVDVKLADEERVRVAAEAAAQPKKSVVKTLPPQPAAPCVAESAQQVKATPPVETAPAVANSVPLEQRVKRPERRSPTPSGKSSPQKEQPAKQTQKKTQAASKETTAAAQTAEVNKAAPVADATPAKATDKQNATDNAKIFEVKVADEAPVASLTEDAKAPTVKPTMAKGNKKPAAKADVKETQKASLAKSEKETKKAQAPQTQIAPAEVNNNAPPKAEVVAESSVEAQSKMSEGSVQASGTSASKETSGSASSSNSANGGQVKTDKVKAGGGSAKAPTTKPATRDSSRSSGGRKSPTSPVKTSAKGPQKASAEGFETVRSRKSSSPVVLDDLNIIMQPGFQAGIKQRDLLTGPYLDMIIKRGYLTTKIVRPCFTEQQECVYRAFFPTVTVIADAFEALCKSTGAMGFYADMVREGLRTNLSPKEDGILAELANIAAHFVMVGFGDLPSDHHHRAFEEARKLRLNDARASLGLVAALLKDKYNLPKLAKLAAQIDAEHREYMAKDRLCLKEMYGEIVSGAALDIGFRENVFCGLSTIGSMEPEFVKRFLPEATAEPAEPAPEQTSESRSNTPLIDSAAVYSEEEDSAKVYLEGVSVSLSDLAGRRALKHLCRSFYDQAHLTVTQSDKKQVVVPVYNDVAEDVSSKITLANGCRLSIIDGDIESLAVAMNVCFVDTTCSPYDLNTVKVLSGLPQAYLSGLQRKFPVLRYLDVYSAQTNCLLADETVLACVVPAPGEEVSHEAHLTNLKVLLNSIFALANKHGYVSVAMPPLPKLEGNELTSLMLAAYEEHVAKLPKTTVKDVFVMERQNRALTATAQAELRSLVLRQARIEQGRGGRVLTENGKVLVTPPAPATQSEKPLVSPRFFVKVFCGDILKVGAEAIVNAANAEMDHCGGLAKYLADMAGPSMVRDSKAQLQQMKGRKHGFKAGDALYTNGGKLKGVKNIIHAVGPLYQNGEFGEEKKLAAAVRRAMQLAIKLDCKSVAMPPLSAGIFGYPLEEAVAVIVQTVHEFAYTGIRVTLCSNEERVAKAFQDALEQFLQQNPIYAIDTTAVKQSKGAVPKSVAVQKGVELKTTSISRSLRILFDSDSEQYANAFFAFLTKCAELRHVKAELVELQCAADVTKKVDVVVAVVRSALTGVVMPTRRDWLDVEEALENGHDAWLVVHGPADVASCLDSEGHVEPGWILQMAEHQERRFMRLLDEKRLVVVPGDKMLPKQERYVMEGVSAGLQAEKTIYFRDLVRYCNLNEPPGGSKKAGAPGGEMPRVKRSPDRSSVCLLHIMHNDMDGVTHLLKELIVGQLRGGPRVTQKTIANMSQVDLVTLLEVALVIVPYSKWTEVRRVACAVLAHCRDENVPVWLIVAEDEEVRSAAHSRAMYNAQLAMIFKDEDVVNNVRNHRMLSVYEDELSDVQIMNLLNDICDSVGLDRENNVYRPLRVEVKEADAKPVSTPVSTQVEKPVETPAVNSILKSDVVLEILNRHEREESEETVVQEKVTFLRVTPPLPPPVEYADDSKADEESLRLQINANLAEVGELVMQKTQIMKTHTALDVTIKTMMGDKPRTVLELEHKRGNVENMLKAVNSQRALNAQSLAAAEQGGNKEVTEYLRGMVAKNDELGKDLRRKVLEYDTQLKDFVSDHDKRLATLQGQLEELAQRAADLTNSMDMLVSARRQMEAEYVAMRELRHAQERAKLKVSAVGFEAAVPSETAYEIYEPGEEQCEAEQSVTQNALVEEPCVSSSDDSWQLQCKERVKAVAAVAALKEADRVKEIERAEQLAARRLANANKRASDSSRSESVSETAKAPPVVNKQPPVIVDGAVFRRQMAAIVKPKVEKRSDVVETIVRKTAPQKVVAPPSAEPEVAANGAASSGSAFVETSTKQSRLSPASSPVEVPADAPAVRKTTQLVELLSQELSHSRQDKERLEKKLASKTTPSQKECAQREAIVRKEEELQTKLQGIQADLSAAAQAVEDRKKLEDRQKRMVANRAAKELNRQVAADKAAVQRETGGRKSPAKQSGTEHRIKHVAVISTHNGPRRQNWDSPLMAGTVIELLQAMLDPKDYMVSSIGTLTADQRDFKEFDCAVMIVDCYDDQVILEERSSQDTIRLKLWEAVAENCKDAVLIVMDNGEGVAGDALASSAFTQLTSHGTLMRAMAEEQVLTCTKEQGLNLKQIDRIATMARRAGLTVKKRILTRTGQLREPTPPAAPVPEAPKFGFGRVFSKFASYMPRVKQVVVPIDEADRKPPVVVKKSVVERAELVRDVIRSYAGDIGALYVELCATANVLGVQLTGEWHQFSAEHEAGLEHKALQEVIKQTADELNAIKRSQLVSVDSPEADTQKLHKLFAELKEAFASIRPRLRASGDLSNVFDVPSLVQAVRDFAAEQATVAEELDDLRNRLADMKTAAEIAKSKYDLDREALINSVAVLHRDRREAETVHEQRVAELREQLQMAQEENGSLQRLVTADCNSKTKGIVTILHDELALARQTCVLEVDIARKEKHAEYVKLRNEYEEYKKSAHSRFRELEEKVRAGNAAKQTQRECKLSEQLDEVAQQHAAALAEKETYLTNALKTMEATTLRHDEETNALKAEIQQLESELERFRRQEVLAEQKRAVVGSREAEVQRYERIIAGLKRAMIQTGAVIAANDLGAGKALMSRKRADVSEVTVINYAAADVAGKKRIVKADGELYSAVVAVRGETAQVVILDPEDPPLDKDVLSHDLFEIPGDDGELEETVDKAVNDWRCCQLIKAVKRKSPHVEDAIFTEYAELKSSDITDVPFDPSDAEISRAVQMCNERLRAKRRIDEPEVGPGTAEYVGRLGIMWLFGIIALLIGFMLPGAWSMPLTLVNTTSVQVVVTDTVFARWQSVGLFASGTSVLITLFAGVMLVGNSVNETRLAISLFLAAVCSLTALISGVLYTFVQKINVSFEGHVLNIGARMHFVGCALAGYWPIAILVVVIGGYMTRKAGMWEKYYLQMASVVFLIVSFAIVCAGLFTFDIGVHAADMECMAMSPVMTDVLVPISLTWVYIASILCIFLAVGFFAKGESLSAFVSFVAGALSTLTGVVLTLIYSPGNDSMRVMYRLVQMDFAGFSALGELATLDKELLGRISACAVVIAVMMFVGVIVGAYRSAAATTDRALMALAAVGLFGMMATLIHIRVRFMGTEQTALQFYSPAQSEIWQSGLSIAVAFCVTAYLIYLDRSVPSGNSAFRGVTGIMALVVSCVLGLDNFGYCDKQTAVMFAVILWHTYAIICLTVFDRTWLMLVLSVFLMSLYAGLEVTMLAVGFGCAVWIYGIVSEERSMVPLPVDKRLIETVRWTVLFWLESVSNLGPALIVAVIALLVAAIPFALMGSYGVDAVETFAPALTCETCSPVITRVALPISATWLVLVISLCLFVAVFMLADGEPFAAALSGLVALMCSVVLVSLHSLYIDSRGAARNRMQICSIENAATHQSHGIEALDGALLIWVAVLALALGVFVAVESLYRVCKRSVETFGGLIVSNVFAIMLAMGGFGIIYCNIDILTHASLLKCLVPYWAPDSKIADFVAVSLLMVIICQAVWMYRRVWAWNIVCAVMVVVFGVSFLSGLAYLTAQYGETPLYVMCLHLQVWQLLMTAYSVMTRGINVATMILVTILAVHAGLVLTVVVVVSSVILSRAIVVRGAIAVREDIALLALLRRIADCVASVRLVVRAYLPFVAYISGCLLVIVLAIMCLSTVSVCAYAKEAQAAEPVVPKFNAGLGKQQKPKSSLNLAVRGEEVDLSEYAQANPQVHCYVTDIKTEVHQIWTAMFSLGTYSWMRGYESGAVSYDCHKLRDGESVVLEGKTLTSGYYCEECLGPVSHGEGLGKRMEAVTICSAGFNVLMYADSTEEEEDAFVAHINDALNKTCTDDKCIHAVAVDGTRDDYVFQHVDVIYDGTVKRVVARMMDGAMVVLFTRFKPIITQGGACTKKQPWDPEDKRGTSNGRRCVDVGLTRGHQQDVAYGGRCDKHNINCETQDVNGKVRTEANRTFFDLRKCEYMIVFATDFREASCGAVSAWYPNREYVSCEQPDRVQTVLITQNEDEETEPCSAQKWKFSVRKLSVGAVPGVTDVVKSRAVGMMTTINYGVIGLWNTVSNWTTGILDKIPFARDFVTYVVSHASFVFDRVREWFMTPMRPLLTNKRETMYDMVTEMAKIALGDKMPIKNGKVDSAFDDTLLQLAAELRDFVYVKDYERASYAILSGPADKLLDMARLMRERLGALMTTCGSGWLTWHVRACMMPFVVPKGGLGFSQVEHYVKAGYRVLLVTELVDPDDDLIIDTLKFWLEQTAMVTIYDEQMAPMRLEGKTFVRYNFVNPIARRVVRDRSKVGECGKSDDGIEYCRTTDKASRYTATANSGVHDMAASMGIVVFMYIAASKRSLLLLVLGIVMAMSATAEATLVAEWQGTVRPGLDKRFLTVGIVHNGTYSQEQVSVIADVLQYRMERALFMRHEALGRKNYYSWCGLWGISSAIVGSTVGYDTAWFVYTGVTYSRIWVYRTRKVVFTADDLAKRSIWSRYIDCDTQFFNFLINALVGALLVFATSGRVPNSVFRLTSHVTAFLVVLMLLFFSDLTYAQPQRTELRSRDPLDANFLGRHFYSVSVDDVENAWPLLTNETRAHIVNFYRTLTLRRLEGDKMRDECWQRELDAANESVCRYAVEEVLQMQVDKKLKRPPSITFLLDVGAYAGLILSQTRWRSYASRLFVSLYLLVIVNSELYWPAVLWCLGFRTRLLGLLFLAYVYVYVYLEYTWASASSLIVPQGYWSRVFTENAPYDRAPYHEVVFDPTWVICCYYVLFYVSPLCYVTSFSVTWLLLKKVLYCVWRCVVFAVKLPFRLARLIFRMICRAIDRLFSIFARCCVAAFEFPLN